MKNIYSVLLFIGIATGTPTAIFAAAAASPADQAKLLAAQAKERAALEARHQKVEEEKIARAHAAAREAAHKERLRQRQVLSTLTVDVSDAQAAQLIGDFEDPAKGICTVCKEPITQKHPSAIKHPCSQASKGHIHPLHADCIPGLICEQNDKLAASGKPEDLATTIAHLACPSCRTVYSSANRKDMAPHMQFSANHTQKLTAGLKGKVQDLTRFKHTHTISGATPSDTVKYEFQASAAASEYIVEQDRIINSREQQIMDLDAQLVQTREALAEAHAVQKEITVQNPHDPTKARTYKLSVHKVVGEAIDALKANLDKAEKMLAGLAAVQKEVIIQDPNKAESYTYKLIVSQLANEAIDMLQANLAKATAATKNAAKK